MGRRFLPAQFYSLKIICCFTEQFLKFFWVWSEYRTLRYLLQQLSMCCDGIQCIRIDNNRFIDIPEYLLQE